MIAFVLDYRGPTPRGTKRALPRIQKEAFIDLGQAWLGDMLPDHFRQSAVSKYGYTQRTAGYRAAKLRVKAHRKPLVWSGDTEKYAKANSRVASATSRGVRIVVNAPTLNRTPKGRALNMRREVVAITTDEIEVLNGRFERLVERKLNRVSENRRVRLGRVR